MKPEFLVNRLLRMSPVEVVYRSNQAMQKKWEKAIFSRLKFDYRTSGEPEYLFSDLASDLEPHWLIGQADRICEGYIDIFALRNLFIGSEVNYHKDYKTRLVAPNNSFGKSIDYRDDEKVGNIKYIWELNRLLFLLPLALAYQQTRQKKYLAKFNFYLDEWLKQNPFMLGVNWSSSLELAIRLINWSFCWKFVKDEVSQDLKERWLQSVYQHGWFVNRNLSFFSSANNHLIGEAAGLYIAGMVLPRFDRSDAWRRKGYRILLQECKKQIHSDGVNKEQAVNYHQHTLDYLLICGLVGERYGNIFPREYWDKLEKGLTFLAALEDTEGNIPAIGDDDGGVVINLGQTEYGIHRSLLNTGALLFKRPEWLHHEGKNDLKTMLLMGICQHLDSGLEQLSGSKTHFPEGGYTVLGTDFGSPIEQKAVFDSGPLGYLSIAAHGHADALSFVFSAGGCPIFVDPGTYIYHSQPRWRNYFRSTLAHNTITVDDKDQSMMCGCFMWSSKAKSHLVEHQEFQRVKGWHDGYCTLADQVRHIRELEYCAAANIWTVTDEIQCRHEHYVKSCFHLHPSCEALLKEKSVLVGFPKGQCELFFPEEWEVSILEGSMEPVLGWYSPAYDCKVKTQTILIQASIKGATQLITRFRAGFS